MAEQYVSLLVTERMWRYCIMAALATLTWSLFIQSLALYVDVKCSVGKTTAMARCAGTTGVVMLKQRMFTPLW